MNEVIVLNVGGSILSPSEEVIFDFNKAKELKSFILSLPEYKFILCVGGGFLARKYQAFLADQQFSQNAEHEVGIAAINLNAYTLKSVLEDISEENVLKYSDFDSDSPITLNKQVLISAAGSPGHSSDWNTIKLANRAGQKRVFSLTNIDGVYNKNPNEFSDAILQKALTWQQYLDVIGNPTEHLPGAKYPVDPFASQLAQENHVEFYVLSGKDLENLRKAIKSVDYFGSVIS